MELRWLDFSQANQPIKAIETSTQAHVFLLSIFWVDTNIFLSYTDKPVKLVRSQTTSLSILFWPRSQVEKETKLYWQIGVLWLQSKWKYNFGLSIVSVTHLLNSRCGRNLLSPPPPRPAPSPAHTLNTCWRRHARTNYLRKKFVVCSLSVQQTHLQWKCLCSGIALTSILIRLSYYSVI